jgi:16S rRNA (cytosine967-C5)-methyltransferase
MNARALAIRVLERVQVSDAFLNAALDSELRRARRLDARDSALVTELSYGAARRQMALDAAVARFSAKKLDRLEPRVLCALRAGAYQLFYMRMPKRAAVAETVEALKQLEMSRAAGFANAILRKLSQLEELPLPPSSDSVAHLAVRESHPRWLVSRWVNRCGEEAAEAMLLANNRPPPVAIRVNSTKISRQALLERFAAAGIDAQGTSVSSVGIALAAPGKVPDVLGYSEGLWQVQDEAAQLVVPYAAIPDRARVLDACAAPGGKSFHLAERTRVLASDIHAGKLRKLEAEGQRLGLHERIELLRHDARDPFPPQLAQFDAVLVDAPCSGLGTLHRHPELRYRRKEEDIPRFVELQRAILTNCAQLVVPGGLLVYSVCSTEPEEGEEQIQRFLRTHGTYRLEGPALAEDLPIAEGCLRTLPGQRGWDGFFAARLRRAA